MGTIDWGNLNHAYSNALDIPDMLSALFANPHRYEFENVSWNYLWGCVCHQGDIYSPSGFVSISVLSKGLSLMEDNRKMVPDFLNLPIAIEMCRPSNPSVNFPNDYYLHFERINEYIDCEPTMVFTEIEAEDIKRAENLLIALKLRKRQQSQDLGPLFG